VCFLIELAAWAEDRRIVRQWDSDHGEGEAWGNPARLLPQLVEKLVVYKIQTVLERKVE
jgi:hypothetical protein